MEKRKLGKSELEVTPFSFGGNVFGWTTDEATSFKLLDAFVEAGGNFIDTADVYARWLPPHEGGQSETILGKWLKRRSDRAQLVIATKVGSDMGPRGKGLSRKHILQSVDDSLRRLQTDYIDLYQSHRDDEETPQEETLETYAELIRQGKVRVIGASNFSAARLSRSLQISKQNGFPRYESLQPLYNLYDREDYEQDLEPLCREEGLGVIIYSSLASGFLTGKYRSEQDLGSRARGGSIKRFLNERGFRILSAVDKVAQEYDATPAQVALAWLIARPSITAPIASATSIEQLNELLRATDLHLDDTAIQTLNEASA
ncbi:MAG: aldo/keto reductase [Chloroflexota bacterium]|nr:aldo/keto reductase [Chloroflexota bacterium]